MSCCVSEGQRWQAVNSNVEGSAMKASYVRMLWFVPVLLGLMAMTAGTALAHEGREVAEYRFNIGWINEPAYEGFMNGVELRVAKVTQGDASMEDDGHQGSGDSEAADGMSMSAMTMSGGSHGGGVPVTGLQDTLQVEVTHVASDTSVVLDLYPDRLEAGRYTADLIPTAIGVYEFRVFGFIERELVDQSFLSLGGGGGFDDIRPSVGLHFPEEVASPREMESAVRGALDTAQQAQDAVLAASEDDEDGASGVLIIAVVALVLGGVGLATGAVGVWLALRKG